MNLELNFTNRETYLAWRANWRAVYKAQSEEIRENKQNLRDLSKSGPKQDNERASRLQRVLHFDRRDAARMMEILEEAKALSKASREAQRQAA